MAEEAKTRKQEKPGKVVRVDPLIWKHLMARRKEKETVSSVIRRLLGLPSRRPGISSPPKKFYVLPSDLSESAEEARGRAIIRAVRAKKKPERPIEVREVL